VKAHPTGIQLPPRWDWRPLWELTQPGRPITYGIVQAGPDVPDGVPYIRPVDMTDEDGLKPGLAPRRTAPEIAAAYRRSIIASGDLVVTIGPSYGKVMRVPPALAGANLTQGTARVAPDRRVVDGRYLRWALRSLPVRDAWSTAVGGATFGGLNLGPLSDSLVPVPPLEEQRRIADYLDTETARIDDLTDKNNTLTRTSFERLQRVVIEATLGHPRRPDSQHLSDVFDGVFAPVHTLARVGTGHTPSRNVDEYWDDCDIPWLNIPDLAEARRFWVDEVTETAEHLNTAGLQNSAAVLCPVGTVFVTRTASIGHAVINAVPMATNQRLVTYYPDSRRLDPHFLLWSIRALKMIGHFERLTFGATHDTIYYDDMVALRVPLRNLAEQTAAVGSITDLRDELVALRQRLERSSRLLQERRDALITAAVTGELEV
jgi:type I restriction enzyme, S subunit